MPTVEDYFDDDTEFALPSSSGSKPRPILPDTGLRGALLEEINPDDEMDYARLAEQGRGIFGENSIAPERSVTSSSGKGKLAVRDEAGDFRPIGGSPAMNPNTPMGGFMGDMMKLQQAEDERLERLRKQFGNATLAKDPSIYKALVRESPYQLDELIDSLHIHDDQLEYGIPTIL